MTILSMEANYALYCRFSNKKSLLPIHVELRKRETSTLYHVKTNHGLKFPNKRHIVGNNSPSSSPNETQIS